eukprot:NODE_89_length_21781_cov_0.895836.p19 type:complete len:141 gc:universal NODE_89_length_21781_cov_0.895836:15574-15152(-)
MFFHLPLSAIATNQKSMDTNLNELDFQQLVVSQQSNFTCILHKPKVKCKVISTMHLEYYEMKLTDDHLESIYVEEDTKSVCTVVNKPIKDKSGKKLYSDITRKCIVIGSIFEMKVTDKEATVVASGFLEVTSEKEKISNQ